MLILIFFLCHFTVRTVNTRILLGITSKQDLQIIGLHCSLKFCLFFFNSTVNKIFKASQIRLINSSCCNFSNLQSLIIDICYSYRTAAHRTMPELLWGTGGSRSLLENKRPAPPWGTAIWNHIYTPDTPFKCTLKSMPYPLSPVCCSIQLDQYQLGTFIRIV